MFKTTIFLWILFITVSSVFAHDHWITASEYYPPSDGEIQLVITSGHDFPAGNFLFSDRLFHGLEAQITGDKPQSLDITGDGNRRLAYLPINKAQPYLVRFILQKDPLPEPIFWGKSIIFPMDWQSEAALAFGDGLEVVPVDENPDFTMGKTVALALWFNGEPVSGTLAITPAGKKTTYLTVTENRPAELSLEEPGLYLVTAGHAGKNCSFTFQVRE